MFVIIYAKIKENTSKQYLCVWFAHLPYDNNNY